MTRTTNARLAGLAFLVYIAAGIAGGAVLGRAIGGEGMAAKLAGIAQHEAGVRIVLVLGLLQSLSALVLAVTFHALTRDEDPDLAALGLVCRVTEGVIVGLSVPTTMALLWLATATGAEAPAPAVAHGLAGYLLVDSMAVTATFFAVGSTIFSYLLLRGRMVPLALAWLGVAASVLLVAGLPLRLVGGLPQAAAMLIWPPMLVFELALGAWLVVKGAAQPRRAQSG